MAGAGRRARRLIDSANVPCGVDSTPPCSPRAADLLKRVLRDHGDELLAEWCDAAAEAHRRVPEALLARFLDAVTKTKDEAVRGPGMQVAGVRGRWLAGQNPRWSVGGADAAADPAETWQSGMQEERLLVLKKLRSSDPARARELVSSTWNDEPPEMRDLVVETYAIGLSMADEPFLEDALDDKRKAVRTGAAALLSRLPASRLGQRMAERAAAGQGADA